MATGTLHGHGDRIGHSAGCCEGVVLRGGETQKSLVGVVEHSPIEKAYGAEILRYLKYIDLEGIFGFVNLPFGSVPLN